MKGKIISGIIAIGLLYVTNTSLNLGGKSLPPLGNFLNPFNGFWQNAESSKPISFENISLPGLKGAVEVFYDDRMVPHIFAEYQADAYYIQGYIHASMRLWQMDISSRAAAGRLSEVLGERMVKFDKNQRRQGLMFGAENAIEAWKKDKETFPYLEAYATGINEYIKTLTAANMPLEFKLLNYKPEEWSPLKTALISKAMCNTLCRREHDVANSNLLKMLGPIDFNMLYPEYNPKQSPVIPSGEQIISNPSSIKNTNAIEIDTQYYLGYHDPFRPEKFIGSNNWAVGPSKTASKSPILCNDPHLNLTLPSIWFENQISTKEDSTNVYGISLPGVPAILIGFNQNIAWGITNGGQDFADFYKIKWADSKKKTYLLDGTPKSVQYRVEKIEIKGKESILDSVKYTAWGPIVFEDDMSTHKDLALKWVAHNQFDNTSEVKAFLLLNKAKNFADYSAALNFYTVPMQNFVFAATNGDIALKTQGKLPLKRAGQGRFIQDGSHSSSDWAGFVPYEHNPQVKNPKRGFVSSANQSSTDPKYPYYYNGYFDDYRGRYLNRKLEKMDSISPKDMALLQNDNHSLLAEDALSAISKVVKSEDFEPNSKKAIEMLFSWDKNFEAQKKAPILFELLMGNLRNEVWDEIIEVSDSTDILLPEDWVMISMIENQPKNKYFDKKSTIQVETFKDLLSNVLKKSIFSYDSLLISNPNLKWSSYKKSTIQHLAQLPAFSALDIANGGSGESLNAMKKNHGPSWRMIVEMGPDVKAQGVYPGGQSGNPGSPYYDNMIKYWESGQYYPLKFVKSKSEAGNIAISRLLFEPKK